MIREAGGAADLDAAVTMLSRLGEELALGVPFHAATARRLVEGLAASDRGLVLILDRGVHAGVLLASAQPYAFAPVLAAEEIAWWIAPDARGRWARAMLARFEAWAVERGAALLGVSDTGKPAGHFYARHGFAPGERKHFKVIS